MIQDPYNILSHSSDDLSRMLDALPYGTVSVTNENVIVFSNLEWKKFCGVPESSVLNGTHISEFIPASIREEILQLISRCKFHNDSISESLQQINNSVERILKITVSPLRLSNNSQIFMVSAVEVGNQCPHIEQKRIDQVKSNFLAMISHELRTPLTSIRGAVHLINNNHSEETNNAYNPLFGIISTNTERLIGLVNNLLDMVAIDNNTFTVVQQQADLEELILNCAATVSNSANLKSLDFQISTTPCIAKIDSNRLKQVVVHLLDNAIKFTPYQGKVSLSLEVRNGNSARIIVKDSGCGVSQQLKELIFKRFTQEADTMTRESNGAGIGLYLARSIIERHDGSLNVTDNEQSGSSFIIDIPL